MSATNATGMRRGAIGAASSAAQHGAIDVRRRNGQPRALSRSSVAGHPGGGVLAGIVGMVMSNMKK